MRVLRAIGCLFLAVILWVQVLHGSFADSASSLAQPLARRQLALWQGGRALEASLAELRRTNPEWDLMARLFAVLAFADLAARAPEQRARHLEAIDRILARSVADVERGGARQFLLPYGHTRPFLDDQQRSLFVDGELALMMAVRSYVWPSAAHASAARPWVERVVAQLERAPHLVAESYPDEAWIFCNAVALAAIRLHDAATGEPGRHAALLRRWVASAGARLTDHRTGLLVAKTSYAAEALEGPEGSTLWLASTMLLLVDEGFARAQYARARAELRGAFAGFGWAREWPSSWPGADDVDSGPTVPLLGANAGSSGLALVAARAFGDEAFERELVASLGFAGFPSEGGERFAAGNQLADSVLLWAAAFGPTWQRALGGQP